MDKIRVQHRGFSVSLPESAYFDAVPYGESGSADEYGRPAGRKVQVQNLLLDVGVHWKPRICVYGTWYLLDGSFTKQWWGGGACIHWQDIPTELRRVINAEGGPDVRKWWRA